MGVFAIASASHGEPRIRTECGIQIGTGLREPSRASRRGCGKTSVEGDKLSGLTRNCPVRYGPPAPPPATSSGHRLVSP
ncbi:hypothetical protein SEA_PERMAG_49 [Microbacterium phage PermaG]|nr:hypothetical protein SEA_PERMAG_49 [Microbacterium phage PermaG]